ncbi:hypothetical protein Taro_026253 [Colocasia esculenta]|uniref:RING-CH-type domain-containing protein n=1 Tax=Colocasia esculenta TaxID=4460 RepID=A0A843VK25_COLES|nr:hypothetical protein [Colocasia esculenta]
MASGGEEEVALLVADDGLGPSSSDSRPSSSTCLCRICHEEEEESTTSMEAPCACSGTLKVDNPAAHEKAWFLLFMHTGDAYRGGVTRREARHARYASRGSLEVPRQNYQPQTPNQGDVDYEDDDADYAECSPASQRSASCCQSVAVTFTIILLLRHLISVITVGADHYAFSLMTVFILRASGILLPFYVIMTAIKGIQQVQRIQLQHQQLYENGDSQPPVAEPEDQRLHQHVIEIQS